MQFSPTSRYRYPADVELSNAIFPADSSSGGDRADILASRDGTLNLIILDVCGHGSDAAELADIALNTVKALLWLGSTPATAFASLNRFLLDVYEGRDGFLGSGAIASLNPARTQITFASAGHVDALCFNDRGRTHVHLSATGPLYGVIDDAQYHDEVFPYVTGTALVMVTDGLTEVKHLGTAGICRIIRDLFASAAAVSASRLISEARRAAGGAFEDDVAAIVAAKPSCVLS